jgi:DNA mismatch repair protein MutS
MYARYINEYKTHSAKYGANTAIFMLVGSFYELYDIPTVDGEFQTSMKRATDILGIQNVEKRGDAPGGKNGRFAGFGVTQLHKYASMLTRENWTVVVIDQMKDTSGKVVTRDVARILSPGTHIENSQSDHFYLAGLWLDAGQWSQGAAVAAPHFAATALDLTTGAISTYEAAASGQRDTWSADTLLHFFQVHQPKELIVWWRGHAIDQPTELFLRRTLGVPTALIHVRQACPQEQGSLEKGIIRDDLLRRCFRPKSLLPLKAALGIQENSATERALASILLFVEDHFPAAMNLLRTPEAWTPESSVYLGNHALTQLNMITQREEDSVLGMFLRAYTPMGRRAIRTRLLYPITQPPILEQRYAEIAWCIDAAPELKDAILGNLRRIADLSRLHRRITIGTVNAADIIAMDMSYTCANRILARMDGDCALGEFKAHADAFAEYVAAFTAVFDIEKALRPQDDLFCLTEEAGPKTASIEKEIAAARAKIAEIHGVLSDWTGVEREAFRLEEKEASIVVTANKATILRTSSAIKGVTIPAPLKGIQVHAKKSSSSIEVPALNAQFQRILALRLALASSVREELPVACDTLAQYSAICDKLEQWIARVDMACTIARVSVERGFVCPEIVAGEGASIEARGLRHPLIEAQQTRVEYVKHDVSLRQDSHGWLVYGMNASGKSSLMKAVGVATILAQCGCYVPATTFQFSPFRALFTRILNTDNLWAGLSSFAVEMTELADILRRADQWSLVLGDEVCSGTESMSAMALVGASLEHLSSRRARYIFATHLHGLQSIPTVAAIKGLKVWHLQVRYDLKTQRLVYDRTLHSGAGSSLYGLEVARAMAIPFDVLESAHKIRKELVGVKSEQEAPLSPWNSAVQRRACEKCGSENVRELEVHHIEERATAHNGRLADGTHMNNIRNLVVLCEECHDKVHNKEIVVGPVIQTSEGEVRHIRELQKYAYKNPDFTEEQLALIRQDLITYKTQAPARIIFYIEQRHGIKLTLQRLKTIRASIGT